MDENEIEFNVDTLLEKLGMNIKDGAALCELSYPTMYAIVRNQQARVDLRTLAHLSKGLGVGLADLFRQKSAAPLPEGAAGMSAGDQEKI